MSCKLLQEIDKCISSNTESPYEGRTFVYESRKRRYSMTFWKFDDEFNNIRYYRHQILAYYFGYGGNNHHDEDEYIYIQNGGVLGTSNHFSVSKKLPLEYCFERFQNSISAKENENFFSLSSLDEKESDVDMPYEIQNLIQCIFREKINKINENGWYKHSFNNYYRMLRSEIEVMDQNDSTFGVIQQYIENTHTENHYFYRIRINDVYTINRYGEEDEYRGNLHNKKLLWHGTKAENVPSILSRGLEVAPPSSKPTGAHFGHGIYFTNSSSKAATYCGARWNQRSSEGVLLLCEVALGNMIKCCESEDMYPLPNCRNSVWGKGYFAPDQNIKTLFWNEVEVPYGPIVKGGNNCNTKLSHDEFVVYDSKQIRIRYLVHVGFEYEDDDYDDDDDDEDEDDDDEDEDDDDEDESDDDDDDDDEDEDYGDGYDDYYYYY